MNFFDLHCDTVSTCMDKSQKIRDNNLDIDLTRGTNFDIWVQTYAFWISSHLEGQEAFDNFISQRDFFYEELDKNKDKIEIYSKDKTLKKGICYAIPSIEGGSCIAGDIKNMDIIKKAGVKMITLCWNDDNDIAGGTYGKNRLTDFGKEVIRYMEKENIMVDVSHLNIESFWDVINFADRPVIATHSNSDKIFSHKRNLNDDQIKAIVQMGGIIGVNFYKNFISYKQDYSFDDICFHIDNMLKLGGENTVCMGSDFDGADMPSCLNKIEKIEDFHFYVEEKFGKDIAEKIFFSNAQNFMLKNI
ncbi:MAG: membrane dipeptidase [Oscillospiraceae bacterium]|nr:membrane dipeptidase [Oscillospiraceae bacterium]